MQRNDIYDGHCRGNILIVGKRRCGKTYFMQKLAINNFLGDIAEWVSSFELKLQQGRQKFNQALAAMFNFITFKHLNVSMIL